MSQMVRFKKWSFRNGGNLQGYLLFIFHEEGKVAF